MPQPETVRGNDQVNVVSQAFAFSSCSFPGPFFSSLNTRSRFVGDRDVCDKPLIRVRNTRSGMFGTGYPRSCVSLVARRMREAYHAESALAAEAKLTSLAKELDKTHLGAAASLRKRLQETLRVPLLGEPPTLARGAAAAP